MGVIQGTVRGAGRFSIVAIGVVFLGCGPALPPSPPTMIGLPPNVESDPAKFRALYTGLPRSNEKIRPRPARCLGGGCTVDIKIVTLGTTAPHPDRPPAN